MQSYKILHFCFLLGYIGYLQVLFLSYSKSVQGQSTLTHLQNKSRYSGDKIFAGFFSGCCTPLTMPPPVRERGVLIHPVVMVTILSEFFADSQAFLFPMIISFRWRKGGQRFWEKWKFVTATRPKQMYAAIPSFTN